MKYYLIRYKRTDPDHFIREYEVLIMAESFEDALEKLNKRYSGFRFIENKTFE